MLIYLESIADASERYPLRRIMKTAIVETCIVSLVSFSKYQVEIAFNLKLIQTH